MQTMILESSRQVLRTARRYWPLLIVLALAGGWVWFAFVLADAQGRLDLPRAYAVRMTCEDDPEADLWRGGCDRVEEAIAATGQPSLIELYRAFVIVHHGPSPRAQGEAALGAPEAGFDLGKTLAGQRYGLAAERPSFEGVRSRAHADAVKAAIDRRDRELLVIGRAGLSIPPLVAGAAANLMHPGTMIRGARNYIAVLRGQAKHSDLVAGR